MIYPTLLLFWLPVLLPCLWLPLLPTHASLFFSQVWHWFCPPWRPLSLHSYMFHPSLPLNICSNKWHLLKDAIFNHCKENCTVNPFALTLSLSLLYFSTQILSLSNTPLTYNICFTKVSFWSVLFAVCPQHPDRVSLILGLRKYCWMNKLGLNKTLQRTGMRKNVSC